ncbi:MAG: hypothetical protein RLY89_1987 [Bacteroidota bacterium]
MEKNHQSEKSVWLIIYNKKSATSSCKYEEAVEEALCFGWIDSIAKKRDAESSFQYFSIRKPKSNWSKSNRERVEKLTALGLITERGQKMIDLAKQTGTWEALVDVQNLVIPDDLQLLLNKNKKALNYFLAFSPSSRRGILEWILNAKKAETRLKRIEETVKLAADNIKANQYRQ